MNSLIYLKDICLFLIWQTIRVCQWFFVCCCFLHFRKLIRNTKTKQKKKEFSHQSAATTIYISNIYLSPLAFSDWLVPNYNEFELNLTFFLFYKLIKSVFFLRVVVVTIWYKTIISIFCIFFNSINNNKINWSRNLNAKYATFLFLIYSIYSLLKIVSPTFFFYLNINTMNDQTINYRQPVVAVVVVSHHHKNISSIIDLYLLQVSFSLIFFFNFFIFIPTKHTQTEKRLCFLVLSFFIIYLSLSLSLSFFYY